MTDEEKMRDRHSRDLDASADAPDGASVDAASAGFVAGSPAPDAQADASDQRSPADAAEFGYQAPPASPGGQTPDPRPPLNDQKKNALLRYMAILFGVAFLLVALSFLIQMRDSNQQISQLSKSNASALQNAQKLQDENRALTEETKRLHAELDAAQVALDETMAQAAQTQNELEVAIQDLDHGLRAHQMLLVALADYEKKSPTLTLESLKSLGELKESLIPEAKVLYDNLVAALQAAAEKQE